MGENQKSYKVQIVSATIAVIGVLGAALIANWGEIFGPGGNGNGPVPIEREINISGKWESNIGLKYLITHQDNNFTWKVIGVNQTAEGTISGANVAATWRDPKGEGRATGVITESKDGEPSRIVWSNNVEFYR